MMEGANCRRPGPFRPATIHIVLQGHFIRSRRSSGGMREKSVSVDDNL